MRHLVSPLLTLAGLVTVSAFTFSVLSGDVARTSAVLAAAWLVVGLACLLVGLRRRRAVVRTADHAVRMIERYERPDGSTDVASR